ncbi:universal stress protein [Salinispirillum sp. LH 10-3-1]|uniref:Universal stress protein n=1 Tax=Salinispirillum sp. LH 10-3-1 TaxID=2952525 RepID=A0AB38YFN8_9GAMM
MSSLQIEQIDVLLVPVDGSKGSHKAVRLAAGMAQAQGAELELLYAFPANALELIGPLGETASAEQLKYLNTETFDKLRQDSARKVFDDALAQIPPDQHGRVKEVLLPGDPAEAVLKHANTCKNPMIVVGSRGLSRVRELLLGSVSQRLVHHAHCPVTVVH